MVLTSVLKWPMQLSCFQPFTTDLLVANWGFWHTVNNWTVVKDWGVRLTPCPQRLSSHGKQMTTGQPLALTLLYIYCTARKFPSVAQRQSTCCKSQVSWVRFRWLLAFSLSLFCLIPSKISLLSFVVDSAEWLCVIATLEKGTQLSKWLCLPKWDC